MTHQPRLPEAAQSPYPLHPAPMPERSEAEPEAAASADAGDAGEGEGAGGLASWAGENRAALGAALGIGSAALVAALLYPRYNRRDERDRRTSAARKHRRAPKAA